MASQAASVPPGIRVHYRAGWLTWVSSVTACLEGLAARCDATDVAGMSGYAFHVAIHRELCPSGPTVFPWQDLEDGIWYLGRATLAFGRGECHTAALNNERTHAHAQAAFDLAQREIEAGRPCVMWGAYVPEFAVVVGIEDGNYIVSSFRECLGQKQPPIPAQRVNAPGGPYTLTFPMAVHLDRPEGERRAVERAIRFGRRQPTDPAYAFGAAAYDLWMAALESQQADPMGNSYCAACYAEARRQAQHFIERIARRHHRAEELLMEASLAFATTADALERISTLFPFPGHVDALRDQATIAEARDDLTIARDADEEAIDLLTQARAMM